MSNEFYIIYEPPFGRKTYYDLKKRDKFEQKSVSYKEAMNIELKKNEIIIIDRASDTFRIEENETLKHVMIYMEAEFKYETNELISDQLISWLFESKQESEK